MQQQATKNVETARISNRIAASHLGELPVSDLEVGVGALLLEPEDGVEVAAALTALRRRRVATLLFPGVHGTRPLPTGAATRGAQREEATPAVGGGGRKGEASKQADGAAAAAAASPFFPPPLPLSPRAAGSLQKHGHDAHLPVK